jgi:hypothetical protein
VVEVSIAEWAILERLYADPASRDFVVESVRGVLAGTPVSRSWQHRLLAPLFVWAMPGSGAVALERARLVLLTAANTLLFGLVARRRGWRIAALAVAFYVAGHVLLAYKLEYPWDGVDQLLFITFGVWAAEERPLTRVWPLLVVGAFNHETILYVPLFYVLSRDRKRIAGSVAALVAVGAVVLLLRRLFYRGRPDLPNQTFETALPVVDNHLHVAHNLRQLFVEDWIAGRAHVAVGFLVATCVFAWMCTTPSRRRAAVWSLVVLATIFCFGYVNETRHYLVLVAFWTAYTATRQMRD